jgi:prepilin-type N-terminal cleavage/methylation domain-containing protein
MTMGCSKPIDLGSETKAMVRNSSSKASFCRPKFPARRAAGFTLVEMLMVTVVIGILAAIALANFISAQKKAQVASVMGNMHTTQIASESYATDTGGVYVGTPAGLGPYMPQGGLSPTGAVGAFPDNPISGVSRQVPFQETITDIATLESTRNAPPTASPGGIGQVGYGVLEAPSDTSYCVSGTTDAGLRIGTGTATTIFSNQ